MPPERDAFLQCLVFGKSIENIPSARQHHGDKGGGNKVDAHPMAFVLGIGFGHLADIKVNLAEIKASGIGCRLRREEWGHGSGWIRALGGFALGRA